RLAVTGAILAPTPSPIANAAAAGSVPAPPRLAKNSLVRRNIVLYITESPRRTQPSLKPEASLGSCKRRHRPIGSKIRRQTLFFPIAVTRLFGSSGTASLPREV